MDSPVTRDKLELSDVCPEFVRDLKLCMREDRDNSGTTLAPKVVPDADGQTDEDEQEILSGSILSKPLYALRPRDLATGSYQISDDDDEFEIFGKFLCLLNFKNN